MRYFNTSGPCDPEKHYTVMREALVAQGAQLVAQGRYFTIFAPRQSGKTTYFQLLLRTLREKKFSPIWISFEGLKTLSREDFYRALNSRLALELRDQAINADFTIQSQLDLETFFKNLKEGTPPIVLVIDEFEDIPDVVLSEVMHIFRSLYHKKQHHGLHSLILVGVSTLAELILSSASPFNITDDIQVPYFTPAEVGELIHQYVAESGQSFEPDVITAIHENTAGQPGLVNGLCALLVTEIATERTVPVAMMHFYRAEQIYLRERFNKNISNVVQKAREKRHLILRLLFLNESIPFTVHDPDIGYLYAHGVVASRDGYVDIPVPLYSKALIDAFRPKVNGEMQYFVSIHETFQGYVTAQAGINVKAILAQYRDYVRRRGFRAFQADNFREAAGHYSLDAFINFFVERLGGHTFTEVPSGRGRTDILILYKHWKYIIETKIFTDNYAFQQGKRQLAEYLTSEGLAEGYYVVFSNLHGDEDEGTFDEEIAGKHIHTVLMRIRFEQPSGLPPAPKTDAALP